MPERLSVRPCAVGDATTLRALRLEALRDTPDAFGSTYGEASKWPMRRWVAMATDFNYYLGEIDGTPAGIASGGWNERYADTHWLFGMFVTRAARGSGLADLLVEAVVAWARGLGADALYLHVTSSVTRAQHFYTRVGFAPTGEQITMDRDPSLQLITMVKHLAP